MLDHNDQLPEEQAYPDLIQKLQTTYQMKPEEMQILTRVHARLAQNSQPLPILAPTQFEAPTPISTLSLLSQYRKSKQNRFPRLNVLVATLVIALLTGSLLFTFSLIQQNNIASLPPTIRLILLPVEKDTIPSQNEMETIRTILVTRFSQFGLRGSSVSIIKMNNQPAILAELPHFGKNEPQIIYTLLETGKLEFWDTGPYGLLTQGSTFKPEDYTRYNPNDQPRFANHDLNPKAFSIVQDLTTKQYDINFAMQGDALNHFQHYTANAIGHALTITLDKTVLDSAIIQSDIPGIGTLSDNFTQQQANALVSILKSTVLPIELKQIS
jgi:hypothetical protein